MDETKELIMEQEVAKGHMVKAVLLFLNSFLQEQQSKIIPMLEAEEYTKADLVIADLTTLSRVADTLKHCVKLGEQAEEAFSKTIRS